MKFQTLDAKTLQVESLLRKMNKFIEGNGGAAGINSRAKRRQVGRKPRVEEILRQKKKKGQRSAAVPPRLSLSPEKQKEVAVSPNTAVQKAIMKKVTVILPNADIDDEEQWANILATQVD